MVFGILHIKQGLPELRAKIGIPGMLSYLAYGSIDARVPGLREFPREDWPPLLLPFATYHLMMALGMFFIAVMAKKLPAEEKDKEQQEWRSIRLHLH